MATITIFNYSSMSRKSKNFKTKEEADAYFENKKAKANLACEPREKWFTYINSWGNRVHVQKMY